MQGYNQDLGIFYKNDAFYSYNKCNYCISNFIYEIVKDNPFLNLIEDITTKTVVEKNNVKSYVLDKIVESSYNNTYFKFFFKFNNFILRLRYLNRDRYFDNTSDLKKIYRQMEFSLYDSINNDFIGLFYFKLFNDNNFLYDTNNYKTAWLKKFIIISNENFLYINFIENYTAFMSYLDSSIGGGSNQTYQSLLKCKFLEKNSPYIKFCLFKNNNDYYYGSNSSDSNNNISINFYNITDSIYINPLHNLNYYNVTENKLEYIEGKSYHFDGKKILTVPYLYDCSNLNQSSYCIKIDSKIYYPIDDCTLIRIE